MRCIRAHQFTTMVVMIVYCAYYESLYFSLSSKLWIYNQFFHFYFLNIDISVNIQVINLKFAMCVPKYLFKGSLSRISYLGPGSNFM